MCHWCAITPKGTSALPSPGCRRTCQVAHAQLVLREAIPLLQRVANPPCCPERSYSTPKHRDHSGYRTFLRIDALLRSTCHDMPLSHSLTANNPDGLLVGPECSAHDSKTLTGGPLVPMAASKPTVQWHITKWSWIVKELNLYYCTVDVIIISNLEKK